MERYQQRVIDEHAELNDRLHKLIEFFGTGQDLQIGLPAPEKTRLSRQMLIMQLYEQVLRERIDAFV
jgi:hypothetical protein